MGTVRDRLTAIVSVLGLAALLLTPARPETYAQALLHFTADSFDETIAGINGVVASGNPLAAKVVAALQEGRLFFSAQGKTGLIGEPPHRLIDAATGQAATGPPTPELAPVRLNNRLRRIVEAALGSLTLMAPDPGKRLEA